MAKNELLVGEPRLGWFIDGNPDTEQIAVMLQDTGTAIELTIPLRGMFAADDPYGRWWSSGFAFNDDPDRTKHSYKPPRVLLLHDNNGPVVLVGCRSGDSSTNFNVGQGRIVANYAVLGGRTLKYEKIHGLRTEIPALAAWTRLSSMEVKTQADTKNRVQSVQMTLADAPPVPLARPVNLTMRSSWRTQNPRGSFLAYEGVKLDTTVRSARTWDEHLHIHDAVLNLVSIAAWQPFGYSEIEVHRTDDPERNLAGGDMGERWSQVATHRLPKHKPWSKEPRFLFPYSGIGPRGISRWLRLQRDYDQAVGPLLGILRADDQWSHSSVVQSGIALEALGYLIEVRKNNGAHLNSRKQINFKIALQVILGDMRVAPFVDTASWIRRASDVYMGAKHPDRSEPDSLVMLNTLRENLLILRCWIALQLGVTAKSLSERLSADPLAHDFFLAD
ncbi:MAG: HEPN domain-containing protein [Thermoleophilaceae bacterium]